MGNISYRLGKALPPAAMEGPMSGAYDRFRAHLEANEIDLKQVVAGPALTMDQAKERFTGEHAAEANRLARGTYRKPFVVPEKV
jgi:hypothetical protein